MWKLIFDPPYRGSENFQKPIISQKMKIIVWGYLIAQIKRFDALITTQKTPALCKVPFKKKKSRKSAKKNGQFWKLVILGDFSWFFPKWDFAERWGFLRCNQCIRTLHLSYQTPSYDDFHFLAYNGFLQFFRPLVGGVKNQFSKFSKKKSVLLGQKAFKTMCPGTLSLIWTEK